MDDLEDKILEITALEAHAMKNTQRNAPDTDNVTAVEKDTADVTAVETTQQMSQQWKVKRSSK